MVIFNVSDYGMGDENIPTLMGVLHIGFTVAQTTWVKHVSFHHSTGFGAKLFLNVL